MPHRIKTLDAHVGGGPVRLVVEGCPTPRGSTMLEKRQWATRHLDGVRRVLMHEPRGHRDMCGALLTEPVEAGSDAGVLFMHNAGFSTMCGHGIIGVVTMALERGVLQRAEADAEVRLDVPAGTVQAIPVRRGPRVERVSFVNVPSFVLAPGVRVELGSRAASVDVAFGGAFYAIVDGEAVGVALRPERVPVLREVGVTIMRHVESMLTVVHPSEPRVNGIHGTIFTGLPDSPDADLRHVVVFADGQVDRSPSGSGTAAVMAVLDAMGLLASDQPFIAESVIGTRFRGTIEERTTVGELPAIRPRIEGSAWITGEHLFLIDDDDPLSDGIAVS